MTGEDATKRLAEINEAEFRKLATLARRIGDESRTPIAGVARAWSGSDTAQRRKAEAVLVALRELAVGPWLSLGQATAGGHRLRAFDGAARSYLGAQQRMLEKLKRLMQSKTPMPPPPDLGGPKEEEQELPSRACDEAYLFARRLLKTGDSALVITLTRTEFLERSEGQRDAEIDKYLKTGKWTVYVDWKPDEV